MLFSFLYTTLILFLFCFRGIRGDLFKESYGMDIDEPLSDVGVHRALDDLSQLQDGSKGLKDFTPISNKIYQNQTQFYSFNVNTTAGVGEYYQFLVFLSGNICSEPNSSDSKNNTRLFVNYSYNTSIFLNLRQSESVSFTNGYFQALAHIPLSYTHGASNTILYIAVTAPPTGDPSDTWHYQIGASQNDLVFQWDDRSWASLIDSDYSSALVVTGNLTYTAKLPNFDANLSRFSLYIYSYDKKDYFGSLNNSWCAVKNGPALLETSNFSSKYTNRSGALQQEFYIAGLNLSTKYIAYLISDLQGASIGGTLYQPFEFETMSDDTCKLIHDLDFCDKVAYSVPNSNLYTDDELKKVYDNNSKSLFSNFSKALQQIDCNTTKDAIYSPIRSCQDCADSYKSWLCAVTIPRCSTRNITGYRYRKADESRNDFINDVIQPRSDYFEILPCVNVCQAMVRDCPASFEFSCPRSNDSIQLSYYWDIPNEYSTCNYVGKIQRKSSLASTIASTNLWKMLLFAQLLTVVTII